MKEYKRLTERRGNLIIDNCGNCPNVRNPQGCTDAVCYEIIRNRLAELEDKIENKMLIELPCKIGDTIYYANIFTSPPRIEEYVVTGIKIYANELLHKISTEIECYPVKDGPCSFGRYAFTDSNSIFTSRAKAKQELEKFQNE
jgi:hypothetical protein